MPKPSTPPSRGETTRQQLLMSATAIFARDGFDAASTRTIAETAKVNQALIAYHFGNKLGLYLAVFTAISEQMHERLGPRLSEIARITDPKHGDPMPGPAQWREALLNLLDGMLQVLSREDSSTMAQLIIREQQRPTEAFTIFYDGFMSKILEALTRLVRLLRPSATTQQAKLLVLSILGQVLIFRTARAGVSTLLSWSHIEGRQVAAISAQLRDNIHLLFPIPEG